MNTVDFLLSAWTWDVSVLIFCALLILAYVLGYGVRQRRKGFFLTGVLILGFALVSPLNTLTQGYLFSAHMTQHILLLLAVPALVLLGLPPTRSKRLMDLFPKILRNPIFGWAAGVGSMWLWHEPNLCNAATESGSVHAVQTGSLLLLGTAFWWQILAPREVDRLQPPGAVLYLFSACVACSLLGIMLTLSPVTVCPAYAIARNDPLYRMIHENWGFTTQRDQQVGGLLMWVPMCMVYLAAIFAQLARWFAQPAPQSASAHHHCGSDVSPFSLGRRGSATAGPPIFPKTTGRRFH
jgi:cytochrome c oxidase assembly factor CtaG